MDFKKVSIGFFGTPLFALESLKNIFHKQIDIKYVVTQCPKPSGRGKKIKESSVAKFSKEKKIPLYQPMDIQDPKFISSISNYEVDFIVVVAYGKILDVKIINLPRLFCLNIHGSILPKWRGAAPIERAILHGDKETGVSIMIVEKKLDSGPIVMAKKIVLDSNDNAGKIYKKLSKIGSELIVQSIKAISEDNYSISKQSQTGVTYAKKICKKETKIEWTDTAETIDRKIRAFSPDPGAWFYFLKDRKKIRIKVLESAVINGINQNKTDPYFIKDFNLIVRCKEKYIKIKTLKPEGKKIMNVKDFLNGLSNVNFTIE